MVGMAFPGTAFPDMAYPIECVFRAEKSPSRRPEYTLKALGAHSIRDRGPHPAQDVRGVVLRHDPHDDPAHPLEHL